MELAPNGTPFFLEVNTFFRSDHGYSLSDRFTVPHIFSLSDFLSDQIYEKNYQIASRYPIFFPCQIFCQIRFMEKFYQIASWYPIFFPSQIRSWKFCIPLYDYPNKLATHHVDQHRNQLRAYNFDVQFVKRTIATKRDEGRPRVSQDL